MKIKIKILTLLFFVMGLSTGYGQNAIIDTFFVTKTVDVNEYEIDSVYVEVYKPEPTIKPVFDLYNFNSGSYTIYVTHYSDQFSSIADSLGIFYIQDTVTLNTIKNEWQFLEAMESYECGYDFVLYITKNDDVKEVLKLNLKCNSLTSNKGHNFEFNSNKLYLLKDKSDTLEKHIYNYPTRKQAIKALDSLRLDSSNFIPKKNNLNWYLNEGYFLFSYSFDPESKPDFDSLKNNLETRIKSSYPDEPFKIEFAGCSPRDYLFKVYSSEALFLKFDLFDTILDFKKYDYFEIELYKKLPTSKP